MHRSAIALVACALVAGCGEHQRSKDRDDHLADARQAAREKKWDEALAALGRAAGTGSDAEVERARGNVLWIAGRSDEAAAAFGVARKLDPQDVDAAIGAGLALADADKANLADAHFAEAIRLLDDQIKSADDPASTKVLEAKLKRAVVTALRGFPEAAVQQLDMIAAKHPGWTGRDFYADAIRGERLRELFRRSYLGE